jgi:D-alanyl-D-alanine endopeptidase (penicillin-binding protein 7)
MQNETQPWQYLETRLKYRAKLFILLQKFSFLLHCNNIFAFIPGVAMARAALAFFISIFLTFYALTPALAKTSSKHPVKQSAKKAAPAKLAPARRVRTVIAQRGKPARRGERGRHTALPRLVAVPAVPVVPPVRTAGDLAGLNLTHDPLALKSNAALVIDQSTSEVLFEKNADVALPIASLTKLMTSMVVVEANQNMDEMLTVTDEDVDREKFSRSRLRVGSQLSRSNMLHIALMSSENRAASALGRNYPGGLPAFVAAMNAKARSLGMSNTHYVEPTGLSSNNVASARDLARLVLAATHHSVIRQYSTDSKYAVEPGGPILQYRNSNHLVDSPDWDIGLQKTGYITEAGHCLVMQSKVDNRPVVMVFLDSKGKTTRLADASRVRKWLESTHPWGMNRTLAAHN